MIDLWSRRTIVWIVALCCAVGLLEVLGASAGAFSATPTPSGFGFKSFDVLFGGDLQAGSHPPDVAVVFTMNVDGEGFSLGGELGHAIVNLPVGLTGNPGAVAQCTRAELDVQGCPVQSQVGIGEATLGETNFGGIDVYNMVPPPNIAAQFAFVLQGNFTFLDVGVRSGSDYGLTTNALNIVQRGVTQSKVVIWGVPGEHTGAGSTPLLTLPSSCEGPQPFGILGSTWQEQGVFAQATFLTHDEAGTPAGFEGCEKLHFNPSIALAPDTVAANAPAGLTVDVQVPQEGFAEAGGLAAADIKDARIVLPAGLAINPPRAEGLALCPLSQDGVGSEAAPSCPPASRVGSVRIVSPALRDTPEGGVYVLQSSPPNVKLLLAASADGVNVKAIADTHLDESTGQITTTLENLPQQPASDVKVSFDGGPRAALVTPSTCGSYTTSSDFTPWSTPFTADALPSSSFAIESGAGGASCPAQASFGPSMVAGMEGNQAGAFGAFSATFSRSDSEQNLQGVSVRTPPGLLALLKRVERCPEPQASLGTCGQGSLIGRTTVAVGAGPDPVYVQGGQVFLTGPYRGTPFGLSVVVPAVAGPFNLGNVVVRAAIGIDPHTAQPTIASDPLPTILDGVPLQLRVVSVTIDRPGFMFNPTSCEPLAVTGTLTSTQGASAGVSSRFQAANCTALGFHPVFSVSTQAQTSKKSGASLTVKAGFPAGAQANIRSVAVVLPKQLPARLTTIQQACPEAVFAANPASCPTGSVIGTGVASTPVLATPVTGPAYLVSHGGAAFPDVVIVFQAEGVTLDLVGSISIKKGVTSSTFATVPDAPISSFQLTLPEGPHSGLAAVLPAKARGSLCGTSLSMPFALTAQNGAVLKETPRIAVTGCAKARKKAKAKKHKKGKK
jgi:hypothetical protein